MRARQRQEFIIRRSSSIRMLQIPGEEGISFAHLVGFAAILEAGGSQHALFVAGARREPIVVTAALEFLDEQAPMARRRCRRRVARDAIGLKAGLRLEPQLIKDGLSQERLA